MEWPFPQSTLPPSNFYLPNLILPSSGPLVIPPFKKKERMSKGRLVQMTL